MARIAFAIVASLLSIATVVAGDGIGERSELPSVGQTVAAASKNTRRPKPTKDQSMDYLVVTLSNAS
jgi:hypothetical protein